MNNQTAKAILLNSKDQTTGAKMYDAFQVNRYIEAYSDDCPPWRGATRISDVQDMFLDFLKDEADGYFNMEMIRSILQVELEVGHHVHIQDFLESLDEERENGKNHLDNDSVQVILDLFNDFMWWDGF